MRPEPSLTVISLGGGVQSSVMALMAGEGAFDRVPDCAIFADTRWEPPSVYQHLRWLSEQLGFPLHVVDKGRSLRELFAEAVEIDARMRGGLALKKTPYLHSLRAVVPPVVTGDANGLYYSQTRSRQEAGLLHF